MRGGAKTWLCYLGPAGMGGEAIGAAPVRLGRLQPRWVWLLFALVFVVGTVRFFTAQRPDGSPEIRIGNDGRYYWAQLTSLVLDRDLDAAHQKFLVSGFGAGGAVARTARVLVPLNLAHGVELHLLGRTDAAAAVRLIWNGRELARADVPPGPFDLPATLPPDQVGRGMNLLDLTVTAPVRLDKLTLRQLP